MNAVLTGKKIEDRAVEYLQNIGIIVLHRNFSCKCGEIDLIAVENETLLFIEVRYRKNLAFGSPAETITLAKQQKIIRAAEFYLQAKSWATKLACRFDVIAVTESMDDLNIEWIKDAFNA
ncbi:MAG TPA: YraN family protein [Gammaproteobacteria bacterium]|nr:YraN family protein [Gammaproteobacteria bacterium]